MHLKMPSVKFEVIFPDLNVLTDLPQHICISESGQHLVKQ